MMRRMLVALVVAAALGSQRTACAQLTSLADDIILISEGVKAEQDANVDNRLSSAGSAQNRFGTAPGGGESRMRSDLTPTQHAAGRAAASHDVLAAISNVGQRQPGSERLPIVPRQELPADNLPAYGQLEVPEGQEDGPPNGLTLDAAIEILVRNNIDLRTKAYEIPKARADVLTASLRANPMVFGSISSLPYGSYSPTRPGESTYSATVIYPFDVSHKRISRTEVASRAQQVLEAQYQDAVRIEIDNLYTAYVDLVAARETVRFAQASQSGLDTMAKIMEQSAENSLIARSELEKIEIQRDLAELGVEQAQLAVHQARQHLVVMLNLPSEESERLELRATLRDTAPLADRSKLLDEALASRPDLTAYRLGVGRAQADVRLAEAEKTTDVFALWSPWELRNNQPTGGQNATSWSVAAFGSIPLFNRNQGNIRRAQVNVTQTQTELGGLERQAMADVDHAYSEYAASRSAVDRIEHGILPRSRRVRDIMAHSVRAGQASPVDYLTAQRDYNEVVRQYRDALIRHRRAMLRLNTAVARRVVP